MNGGLSRGGYVDGVADLGDGGELDGIGDEYFLVEDFGGDGAGVDDEGIEEGGGLDVSGGGELFEGVVGDEDEWCGGVEDIVEGVEDRKGDFFFEFGLCEGVAVELEEGEDVAEW